MFTQPSVNQIASTYQVKPAPLAQKVEADKKQHGGIPQDLRQLLALNDITEGRNAMGIQQALQIPTNMPTVAQSLQQQAQQAIQARLMDQAREQQRLQQKPPTLPLGTPQPRRQPQGIDALETNVGEEYAHGGIIGFSGTGSSQFVQDLSNLPQAFDEMKQRAREEDARKAEQDRRMEQYKQDRLAAQQKTSLFNYLFGSPENEKEGQAKLTELSNTPVKNTAPTNTPASAGLDEESQKLARLAGSRAETGQNTNAALMPGATTPATKVKNEQGSQGGKSVNEQEKPGSIKNLVSSIATPGGDYERKILGQDENALAAAKRAAYLKEVGNRDLSIYDQMAEELKARKERLNAPKAGYDAMMEYLSQIAQSGGRTWQAAGARGAQMQNELQRSREAQQNELMDKILDLGMKKSEAVFNEKKGMFELTQAEKDKILNEKREAAKTLNQSEDKAKELAQQEILEREKMLNQLKAASIGAHDNLMSRARALMAADPTKKMTLEDAMKRAAMAAGATSVLSTESKDKAKGIQELIALNEKMPAGLRQGNSAMAQENRRIYQAALTALENTYGPLTSGINTLSSAQAAPLPPKNELVVGQIYQTAKGPAKWNGTAFEQ